VNYNSIDNLPIYNYNKILETGNLTLYGVLNEEDWEKIEREFFDVIGYGEKYFEILRIKADIVKKKAQYYSSGNDALKPFIQIEEAKLKQISQSEGNDFDYTVAQLSKFMGFKIDSKTTTVKEFYSYIKLAQNG